jgi:hypothetical protein
VRMVPISLSTPRWLFIRSPSSTATCQLGTDVLRPQEENVEVSDQAVEVTSVYKRNAKARTSDGFRPHAEVRIGLPRKKYSGPVPAALCLIRNTFPYHPASLMVQRGIAARISFRLSFTERLLGDAFAVQILSSGTAAAPNYAEARGVESRADFIHKTRTEEPQ